jgi:hypothetical protein
MSGAGGRGPEDVEDLDDEEDSVASEPARSQTRTGFIAFWVASVIAVGFIYSRCSDPDAVGPLGGFFGVVFGIRDGVISWVVSFPLAWMLIAGMRRIR